MRNEDYPFLLSFTFICPSDRPWVILFLSLVCRPWGQIGRWSVESCPSPASLAFSVPKTSDAHTNESMRDEVVHHEHFP